MYKGPVPLLSVLGINMATTTDVSILEAAETLLKAAYKEHNYIRQYWLSKICPVEFNKIVVYFKRRDAIDTFDVWVFTEENYQTDKMMVNVDIKLARKLYAANLEMGFTTWYSDEEDRM